MNAMVRRAVSLSLFLTLVVLSSESRPTPTDEEDEVEYTSMWVVRVSEPEFAEKIAAESGYRIKKMLDNFPNTFLFEKENHHRTRRESVELTKMLTSDDRIEWAEQQVIHRRVKRNRANPTASRLFIPDPQGRGAAPSMPSSRPRFNDELWSYQWYMRRTVNMPTLPLMDLKIEEAWAMGYTGSGVVLSIIDDVVHLHPEKWRALNTCLLEWAKKDPEASYDANDNDPDPFPRYDAQNTNAHGTKCAGEIVMRANNHKCGVGVAFNAKIGGVRCLDGPVVDEIEAAALSFNNQHIDIYSASWGPPDDGRTVEGPKRLTQEALLQGVTKGRQGKGVIYVWASGNGGVSGDNCNCDGYVSSIYTLSIGAATQHGRFPWYGERCASIIAVAYSSGTYTDQKVATTDLHDKCTLDHTGTSAAAPLAAGIIALLLEARSDLTWRDVQHLVAFTSDFAPLMENKGWKRNAAGLLFNSRFGFGLLDAALIIKTAKNWSLVPPKAICSVTTSVRLPLRMRSGSFVAFQTNGCRGSRNEVNVVEHVQLFVNIEHPKRGSLELYLKSPSGTVSMLLSRRPNDLSRAGFTNWHFTSLHFWGERPHGRWRLMIRERGDVMSAGTLQAVALIVHGTRTVPLHLKKEKRYADEELVASALDSAEEYEEEDLYGQNAMINDLSPISNNAHIVNWNDYGYALGPLMSDQGPQIKHRSSERISFNISW